MKTTKIAWPKNAQIHPSPGDRAVACLHAKRQSEGGKSGVHIFYVPGEPIAFRRPDGSVSICQWVLMCEACFERYRDNPLLCPVNNDCELALPLIQAKA